MAKYKRMNIYKYKYIYIYTHTCMFCYFRPYKTERIWSGYCRVSATADQTVVAFI